MGKTCGKNTLVRKTTTPCEQQSLVGKATPFTPYLFHVWQNHHPWANRHVGKKASWRRSVCGRRSATPRLKTSHRSAGPISAWQPGAHYSRRPARRDMARLRARGVDYRRLPVFLLLGEGSQTKRRAPEKIGRHCCWSARVVMGQRLKCSLAGERFWRQTHMFSLRECGLIVEGSLFEEHPRWVWIGASESEHVFLQGGGKLHVLLSGVPQPLATKQRVVSHFVCVGVDIEFCRRWRRRRRSAMRTSAGTAWTCWTAGEGDWGGGIIPNTCCCFRFVVPFEFGVALLSSPNSFLPRYGPVGFRVQGSGIQGPLHPFGRELAISRACKPDTNKLK